MSPKINDPEEKPIVKPSDDTVEKSINDPLDVVHYPLWIEFKEKAPGTHKHTQNIINIVDSITSDVPDVNTKALHLATMYHDIGKMWAPYVFTENQSDVNMHDDLSPAISYHLITKHVSDTASILIANEFPIEVINIAIQHHGTTVLRSIYEKCKKDNKKCREEDFRYQTQKPNSLESLILMICDQVEATSKSIYVDQQKDIDPETFVASIFNKLMMDGQFDNVKTELGNLNKIQKALVRDVTGTFGKRVRYEEDDNMEKK